VGNAEEIQIFFDMSTNTDAKGSESVPVKVTT